MREDRESGSPILLMPNFETFIGAAAAFCTTASYVPQLRKCWATGETGDISLKMLLFLATGLFLWLVYGVLRGDWVIVLANGVSLAMLGGIIFIKISRRGHARAANPPDAAPRHVL